MPLGPIEVHYGGGGVELRRRKQHRPFTRLILACPYLSLRWPDIEPGFSACRAGRESVGDYLREQTWWEAVATVGKKPTGPSGQREDRRHHFGCECAVDTHHLWLVCSFQVALAFPAAPGDPLVGDQAQAAKARAVAGYDDDDLTTHPEWETTGRRGDYGADVDIGDAVGQREAIEIVPTVPAIDAANNHIGIPLRGKAGRGGE